MKFKLSAILSISLLACTPAQRAAGGGAVGAIVPGLCADIAAIKGTDGSYWGSACSIIAKLIGDSIAAGGVSLATRLPCDRTTPISKKGRPPTAWACPGAEDVAQKVVDAQ